MIGSNLFNAGECEVLDSERLILRPLEVDDLQAIMAYATDPETVKWLSIGVQTEEQVLFWLTKQILSYSQPSSSLTWAICLQETGECIGCIELVSDGTIGYASAQKYWGNGYMTEAVRIVTSFAFKFEFIDCLKIPVYQPNIASQKVALNNGFTQGSLIPNHTLKNGESLSAYVFRLTKEEYFSK